VIRVKSDEFRRRLRHLLTEVEGGGVVEISRYQDTVAVMVPFRWYERATGKVGEPDPVIDRAR
jgi:antitoxin (DNA-binding transcriptional repressor) of toxin-antitoxin stability system